MVLKANVNVSAAWGRFILFINGDNYERITFSDLFFLYVFVSVSPIYLQTAKTWSFPWWEKKEILYNYNFIRGNVGCTITFF